MKAEVVREWRAVPDPGMAESDWKLVETIKDSPFDAPLRTVAWVWSFDGLRWHASVSGKSRHEEEESVEFNSAEEAKGWAETVWRLEQ